MPLLTIADLSQPPEVVTPYIQRARTLSGMYLQHLATSQTDTHKYDVSIWGGSTRSKGIHASEISKCMRQIVYCIMGTERRPPVQEANVNMLMRFSLGTAVHSLLQHDFHRLAEKSGGQLRFKDEIRIGPKLGGPAQLWNIRSSADGIFTFMGPDGQPELRVGLEIKTMSPDDYADLKSPQNDHMEQATVYMATLDLPLLWFLYYNKGNSNFTESSPPWLIQFDAARWNNDLEIRFARCTHMAQIGELPDRTEGFYCKWCHFAHTCSPTSIRPRAGTPFRLSSGMRRA